MKKFQLLLLTMFVGITAMAQTTWDIDKEISYIGFGLSHFGVAQRLGHFREFDAKLTSTTDDFSGAAVTFTAKTASVSTDNEQRDKHVRSDAFLNATKYPEMKFVGVLIKEAGQYKLKGDLTIRAATKPVEFAVQYTGRAESDSLHFVKVGFVITGRINRLDYGILWDEKFEGGGRIVGEMVEINVIAEFNKE
jgi:polyisoprenoid-binding protein YceI